MNPLEFNLESSGFRSLLSAFCNKNIYEIIILSFSGKMEAFVLGVIKLVLSVRGCMFFPNFINTKITYLSLK